jgi:hypothetical protein
MNVRIDYQRINYWSQALGKRTDRNAGTETRDDAQTCVLERRPQAGDSLQTQSRDDAG